MSLGLAVVLLAGVAQAASRLIVTMEQSASLVIDGQVHPPAIAGQRVTINHIAPGGHTLEVHDPGGQVLYSASLDIPDGATVQARWSTAGGLVYEGQSASTLPPPVHTDANSGGNPYADVGSGSTTVSGSIPGASSYSSTNDGSTSMAAGGTDGVSTNNSIAQAAGQTAQNIAYNAVPGGNIVQSVSGTGLGRAVASGLGNSAAGTSFGSSGSSASRQIIKPDPEAILGDVILYNRSATPLHIYVDGMYRGQIGGDEQGKTMGIEIGQRLVEFWIGDTPAFKGELQVDQHVPVQLEVSDVTPPKSPNRSWAWADRY